MQSMLTMGIVAGDSAAWMSGLKKMFGGENKA